MVHAGARDVPAVSSETTLVANGLQPGSGKQEAPMNPIMQRNSNPIGTITRGARQLASNVAGSARHRFVVIRRRAASGIHHAADRVGDATQHSGRRAGHAIESSARTLGRVVRKHPIACLAVAFGVGYGAVWLIRR
jgi:hypothetical protein